MQKRNSSHDFSKVLVLLEKLEKYRINTENYSSRFEVEQGPLRAIKEQWVALEVRMPLEGRGFESLRLRHKSEIILL